MKSSYDLGQNTFKTNLKKILKKIFSFFGYEITRINNFNLRLHDKIIELEKFDEKNIEIANKFSLASKPNLWSIIQSIKYISENKIQGDLVECGVFKGGSLGLMSKYAEKYSIESKIIGFDTFDEGWLKDSHSEYDVHYKTGKVVKDENIVNFILSVNEVKEVINKYDINDKYFPMLIKGDVLKTLKIENNLPKKISFLRMDTDLYKTTKFQLEILFPRLEKGGVLHIDDYGLCPGVKKAVDEYFINSKIWFHRVDLTCRLMIKN